MDSTLKAQKRLDSLLGQLKAVETGNPLSRSAAGTSSGSASSYASVPEPAREEERPEERRATSLLKQLRACGRRQASSSRAPSGSHVSYGTSAHDERTARQLDSSAFADVSSARPPPPSAAEVYAALETVDDPVRASDPEAGARPKLLAKHSSEGDVADDERRRSMPTLWRRPPLEHEVVRAQTFGAFARALGPAPVELKVGAHDEKKMRAEQRRQELRQQEAMHEQERVKRQVKEAIEAHGESQMEREATRRREEQFRMEELRTTQMVGSAQFFKLLPATLGALLLFAVSEAGLIISMVERDTKTLNDGTRTYEGRQAFSTFGIALTAAGCVGATVCALALIALALFLFLAGLHSSNVPFAMKTGSVFMHVGISFVLLATASHLYHFEQIFERLLDDFPSPPMQSLITAAQILASVLVPVAGPISFGLVVFGYLFRANCRIATYFQLGPYLNNTNLAMVLLCNISILLLIFWTLSRQAAIQDRTIIGAIFRVLAYVNVSLSPLNVLMWYVARLDTRCDLRRLDVGANLAQIRSAVEVNVTVPGTRCRLRNMFEKPRYEGCTAQVEDGGDVAGRVCLRIIRPSPEHLVGKSVKLQEYQLEPDMSRAELALQRRKVEADEFELLQSLERQEERLYFWQVASVVAYSLGVFFSVLCVLVLTAFHKLMANALLINIFKQDRRERERRDKAREEWIAGGAWRDTCEPESDDDEKDCTKIQHMLCKEWRRCIGFENRTADCGNGVCAITNVLEPIPVLDGLGITYGVIFASLGFVVTLILSCCCLRLVKLRGRRHSGFIRFGVPIISLLIVTGLMFSVGYMWAESGRAEFQYCSAIDLTPSLTSGFAQVSGEWDKLSPQCMDYIAVKFSADLADTSLGVFIVIELPLIVFMSLSFYMMARKRLTESPEEFRAMNLTAFVWVSMMSMAAWSLMQLWVWNDCRDAGCSEEYVYGAQDNLTKESEDLTAIFDDTFPLAYNHTSVYEAKKVITYQLFIYKQPFASTAFYLPLAVIGAQFFFGIVLRRIGQYWEISWLTAISSVYRVWAPVTLTYLCLFLGLLSLEVGTWPGTVIGLCLLMCVVTYTLYVLINTYQRWVRSASMGRFVFFFVLRVAMYASHVLLIMGGVQWVYALNLDDIDPPLAVNYAARGFENLVIGGIICFISTAVFVAVGAASDEEFLLSCLAGSINTGYGNAGGVSRGDVGFR